MKLLRNISISERVATQLRSIGWGITVGALACLVFLAVQKEAGALTFETNEYVYVESKHLNHWDQYLVGPCQRVGSAIWVCEGEIHTAADKEPAPGLVTIGENIIDEVGIFAPFSYSMFYECKSLVDINPGEGAPKLFLFRCADDGNSLREKNEANPQNQAGAPQL